MEGILFILNQTGQALQQLQAEVARLNEVVAAQQKTIEELQAKQSQHPKSQP